MKYVFFILVFILIPVSFSFAQSNLSVGSEGLSIDIEPTYIKPLSKFTVSLNDYSFGSQVAGIKWQINNKLMSESANERSVSLVSPEQGGQMVIEAVVELVGGGKSVARKVITPTYLDIIVEPQTRTPFFYQGRSLPSIDSRMNLIALVNGTTVSSNDLIYTWQLNNKVVDGGSLRGKNTITITIPMGQYNIITLEVSNLAGESLVRRSIQVRNFTPKVTFYEVSSLYGQSKRAVTNLSLISDSDSIQAEPYYLDIETYNKPDLLEWKLGGVKSPTSAGNPYQITLARNGGNGRSTVDFHVRNLTQLLQGSQGSFNVNF